MTNGNDLANPISVIDPDGRFQPEYHLGLTKREYFAAMAMQGILANTYKVGSNGDNIFAITNIKSTEQAVLFADSLIEALNKTK